jgi:hypothetical protein
MGETPLVIKVPCQPNERFLENVIIKALPTVDGNYVQTKIFWGGNPMMIQDHIPKTIFFDMRLGPANSEINVNLQ